MDFRKEYWQEINNIKALTIEVKRLRKELDELKEEKKKQKYRADIKK